jgi:hypothetical protein
LASIITVAIQKKSGPKWALVDLAQQSDMQQTVLTKAMDESNRPLWDVLCIQIERI